MSKAACSVSIHAPAGGGDGSGARRWRRGRCFDPRPRRGGRRCTDQACARCLLFRSTPPQGGATALLYAPITVPWVSIHAPAGGGRRPALGAPRGGCRVSIHAPAGGGDLDRVPAASSRGGFDPRPRRGGRPDLIAEVAADISVSIHAPAGGGDRLTPCESADPRGFDPRPRRGGGDPLQYVRVDRQQRFDPRPRRGGRRFQRTQPRVKAVFRSTPPQGGATHASQLASSGDPVSIHAPAGGATR